MDDSVNGKKPSPPENKRAEQSIDKNSSNEYNEDTSPKLGSRMSDTLELDDSANLEQAIRKINDNGDKMDKLSYKICHTSSPISFEKNISEMHKYLEKLDQSSIYSTTSDTEMCAKEVNVSDKTPNVPTRAALLEFERLRQEFKQQIDALRQELMSKNEAKVSNGANDVRAVSGTIYSSEGESSSKIGSFIEESENRQLAECREIIENTPVLRGGLAGKTKRGLRENTEKDLSDNVFNLSEDLSTLEASVEHCNAFAKTRDKTEASNESSKNTAHDLDLTLQKQATEKQSEVDQSESLQDDVSAQNHSIANIKEENKHPDSTEEMNLPHGNRNKAKDESKPAFEHRIKTALFCLSVTLLLGLAFFALVWLGIGLKHKFSAQENLKGLTYISKASIERKMEDLQKSLDAEIKLRRKTESGLKLAQGNLEELRRDKDKAENDLKRNLDELAHYKAKSQLEMEKLRNSRYDEIKERRKTESELKLAQQNLEGMRREKEKAENGPTSHDKASTQREIEDLRKSLKLAQGNLEELRRDKEKAENAIKSVALICSTLFVVVLFGLGIAEIIEQRKAESERKLVQENLEELRRDKEKAENAAKDLQNSLDAEIEQRRKTESELKLAQENLEGMRRDKEKAENGPTSHDKASTQREIEDLRNNLQSAQRNLEKLCCDKDKAENELKRVGLICSTLFIVGMLVLGVFCALFCHSKHELSSEIERRSKAESELKLAQKNLEGMRLGKAKAENATKDLRKVLDVEMKLRRKTCFIL